MNIIIPWGMFGVAVLGIVLYGTWGRKKRRSNLQRIDQVNPRRAA